MGKRKRTKCKTPSRKSMRVRKPTAKGEHYAQHFDEYNDESGDSGGGGEVVSSEIQRSEPDANKEQLGQTSSVAAVLVDENSITCELEEPCKIVTPGTALDASSPSQDNIMSTGEKLGPRNLPTPVLVAAVPNVLVEEHCDTPSGINITAAEVSVSGGNNNRDVAEECLATPQNSSLSQRKKSIPTRSFRMRAWSESAKEELSLKQEIEMATPGTTFNEPLHILPKSVMVVKSQFVREIHFNTDKLYIEPDKDPSVDKLSIESDDDLSVDKLSTEPDEDLTVDKLSTEPDEDLSVLYGLYQLYHSLDIGTDLYDCMYPSYNKIIIVNVPDLE